MSSSRSTVECVTPQLVTYCKGDLKLLNNRLMALRLVRGGPESLLAWTQWKQASGQCDVEPEAEESGDKAGIAESPRKEKSTGVSSGIAESPQKDASHVPIRNCLLWLLCVVVILLVVVICWVPLSFRYCDCGCRCCCRGLSC